MLLAEFLKQKRKMTSFKKDVVEYNKVNGFKPTYDAKITVDFINNEIRTIDRAFNYSEVPNGKEWEKLNKEFKEINNVK